MSHSTFSRPGKDTGNLMSSSAVTLDEEVFDDKVTLNAKLKSRKMTHL
jgi:hypothetical protein